MDIGEIEFKDMIAAIVDAAEDAAADITRRHHPVFAEPEDGHINVSLLKQMSQAPRPCETSGPCRCR